MRNTSHHVTIRFLFVLGAWLMVVLSTASPGLARPDFGVRGGAYTEDDDQQSAGFLGAEALFRVSNGGQWFGNPNIEHAFIDDGDLTSVSFDFHYDFVRDKTYSLWGGAGPTILFRDGDAFEDRDDTDAGVNLVFGGGATRGEIRPYGQMKVVFADDTQAVLAAGIRF